MYTEPRSGCPINAALQLLASPVKHLVDSPGVPGFTAMGHQPADSFVGARLRGICGGLGPHLADVGIGLVVGVDGVRPPLRG
jgi:hypothetical protein